METKYPDKIEVRLVDVPLLRCYYSVHMVNQKQDLVYIRYYTYSNSRPEKNYQATFYENSDYFKLYRDEFEFLWNKDVDY